MGNSEVAVSEERFATVGGAGADGSDLEICYQTFGDPGDEALLLVMGLGGPMTWWDPDFCTALAERGFFVVRFDNRDTGRSSRVGGRPGMSAVVRAFVTGRARTPYALADMAADGVALLDELGVGAAHVAGISMGGMIAQTMALDHPDRVLSLTSIMSTTGRRTVGWQSPRLYPMLLAPKRPGRDAYIEANLASWALIGSPGFPVTDDVLRDRAATTFDRGVSASGVQRQMLAILTQPDRGPRLRELGLPSLVVHGLADRMVHVSGGRATSRALPGSELLLVDGMGHDLPSQLYDDLADAIRRTADRAAHRRVGSP